MGLKISNIIIVPVLISAYLCSNNPFIIGLLSFRLNIDYLKSQKCIERNIPDNSCNACCQLEKLAENEDADNRHDYVRVLNENPIQWHYGASLNYTFCLFFVQSTLNILNFSLPLTWTPIPDFPPPIF